MSDIVNEPEKQEQAEPAAPAAIELNADQLAALNIEGEVSPESFSTAFSALVSKAAQTDELTARLKEVSEKLGTLETAEQERLSAELDKELADYDLDDETAGVVRNLSPEQRKPLLGKLPKKAAPAPEVKEGAAKPAAAAKAEAPKPLHDPKGEAKDAPEDKSGAVDALISAIRKEPKFSSVSYDAARAEARRREPGLFS
jgi:hypothetical protein